VHTWLAQSPALVHVPPVAQPAQLPPQSMPSSAPFLIPSEQLGTWQVPPVHTPLAQSRAAAQTLPLPQGAQAPPPQSMAVSPPFFWPSVQVARTQVPP